MRFNQVNPETFVKPDQKLPANGRGAWTKAGKANGSWRYEWLDLKPSIGTNAEESLDAWATCIGSYAYQLRLIDLGYLGPLKAAARGVFGPSTRDAVMHFQNATKDVSTGRQLVADGTIGTSDAKALLTPLIDAAETRYGIPNHYLRGETNLESAMDTGALGYYIYYGPNKDYRGVDRGVSQINSSAQAQVSWEDAFTPSFAFDWSGKRMRSYYDQYKKSYPKQPSEVLWDAAVCAHNNPSAAAAWAKAGQATTEAAATYVANAKNARY